MLWGFLNCAKTSKISLKNINTLIDINFITNLNF